MKFMTRLKKGHKLTRLGLALAYAGLLVLFACPLATSTLAWFSIGNYTMIRNIEFGFDSSSRLLAQMKDLSSGDWIDPDKDGYFRFSDEFSFSPVSNMFSSKWYNLDLDPENEDVNVDKPKYMLGYGGSEVTSTRETPYATPNQQYICLQFRFSAEQDVFLFLNEEGTAVEADREANAKTASSAGLDEASLNRIDKAVRISFLSNMGYMVYEPNATETSSTYYGGRLNAKPSDGYWDYDEATGKEILYGEYDEDALSLLEYETVTTQEPIGDPFSTLSGVSKIGKQAITETSLSSFKEEGHIKQETSYTLQELGMKASTRRPLLYVPAGETRQLTVSIYIEGWDEDCDSFIEAATMASSVSFSALYAKKGATGFPDPILGKDAKTE